MNVQRLRGAEIDERDAVHVSADVQVIFRVKCDFDRVVRVPANGRVELLERPRRVGFRQILLAEHHFAVGAVVETDEEEILLLRESERDGMTGPDLRDVVPADDFPRFGRVLSLKR